MHSCACAGDELFYEWEILKFGTPQKQPAVLKPKSSSIIIFLYTHKIMWVHTHSIESPRKIHVVYRHIVAVVPKIS